MNFRDIKPGRDYAVKILEGARPQMRRIICVGVDANGENVAASRRGSVYRPEQIICLWEDYPKSISIREAMRLTLEQLRHSAHYDPVRQTLARVELLESAVNEAQTAIENPV